MSTATSSDQSQYVSVKEAAAILGLSPGEWGGARTVRKWCREGKIPAANLGGSAGWRILRSDLTEFAEQRQLRSAIARAITESQP